MILLSLTNDGLKQKHYNSIVNKFYVSYGYDKFSLIDKLEKIGLFEFIEDQNNLSRTSVSDSSLVCQSSISSFSLKQSVSASSVIMSRN
jgi:hypothetical protein